MQDLAVILIALIVFYVWGRRLHIWEVVAEQSVEETQAFCSPRVPIK